MHWELSVGIHWVSVSQSKTYIKRSILTGLMPYRLLRGKKFYTNKTEYDLCVCIRFLQTMKPIGSCNIVLSQRSYLINKFTNDEVFNILNYQLDKMGMGHLYFRPAFMGKWFLFRIFQNHGCYHNSESFHRCQYCKVFHTTLKCFCFLLAA